MLLKLYTEALKYAKRYVDAGLGLPAVQSLIDFVLWVTEGEKHKRLSRSCELRVKWQQESQCREQSVWRLSRGCVYSHVPSSPEAAESELEEQ